MLSIFFNMNTNCLTVKQDGRILVFIPTTFDSIKETLYNLGFKDSSVPIQIIN